MALSSFIKTEPEENSDKTSFSLDFVKFEEVKIEYDDDNESNSETSEDSVKIETHQAKDIFVAPEDEEEKDPLFIPSLHPNIQPTKEIANETQLDRKRRLARENKLRWLKRNHEKLQRLKEERKEVRKRRRAEELEIRAKESEEKAAERRKRQAAAKAEARAKETPEEKEARRRRQAVANARTRANETEEQKKARRKKDAEAKARARAVFNTQLKKSSKELMN